MAARLINNILEVSATEISDQGSTPTAEPFYPRIIKEGCMVEIYGPPLDYYVEGEYTLIEVPSSTVENVKHSNKVVRFKAGDIVINVKNAVGISWIPSGNLDNVILKIRKPSAITLNLPDLLPRDLEGNVIEV